jgi:hypothetical protein
VPRPHQLDRARRRRHVRPNIAQQLRTPPLHSVMFDISRFYGGRMESHV